MSDPKRTVILTLRIPAELLVEITKVALREGYSSRSDYLRALLESDVEISTMALRRRRLSPSKYLRGDRVDREQRREP